MAVETTLTESQTHALTGEILPEGTTCWWVRRAGYFTEKPTHEDIKTARDAQKCPTCGRPDFGEPEDSLFFPLEICRFCAHHEEDEGACLGCEDCDDGSYPYLGA